MKILATIATTALLFSFTGAANAHGGRTHNGGHFAQATTPQFEIRQECRGFGRARHCQQFRVQVVDNTCHEHRGNRFGVPDISFDRSFDAPTESVHCHSTASQYQHESEQFRPLRPFVRDLRRNARDDRQFRGNQRRAQRRDQRRDQRLNREIRQAERDEQVFRENQRAEREAARRTGRSDRANRRARGDNGNRVVFVGRGVIPMDAESERDSQGPAD